MSRYRIRLDDGSEVGPMDLAHVRDWYRQGLADANTPVMQEGQRVWKPLAEILGVPRKAEPARRATAGRSPAGERARSRAAGGRSKLWIGAVLAVVMLAAGGAFAALRYWAPGVNALVAEAALDERQVTDAGSTFVMDLPRGWYALRIGSDLVPAPAGASALLVDGKNGLRGYLLSDSQPSQVAFVEDYLDNVMERRVLVTPALEVGTRREMKVGDLPALRLVGTWRALSTVNDEVVTLWRDGWVYFALVVWGPSGSGADVERASDALLRGISGQGVLERQVQEAVARITTEVPQLSPVAAEILMAQSEARTIEPEVAFRRALATLARGISALSPEESRELGKLTSALYGTMPRKSRARLDAYVRRVRTHEATTPELDREMAGVVKAGVLSLSAESRARLQAIYEKAIRKAAGSA